MTRWSSSGQDICVHDNKYADRLDFNQRAEGESACCYRAPRYCLKSKAPSGKGVKA